MYIKAGLPDRAEKIYAQYCRKKPHDIGSWLHRIKLIRNEINDRELAVQVCRHALELNPTDLWLYKELIGLYSDLHDTTGQEQALEEGRKALSNNSEFMSFYWEHKFFLRKDIPGVLDNKKVMLEKLFSKQVWDKMDPESKQDLATAEYLYENYSSSTDANFSAASIAQGYFRAWEREIDRRITRKILFGIEQAQRGFRDARRERKIKIGDAEVDLKHPTPVQIGHAIEEAKKPHNMKPWGEAIQKYLNTLGKSQRNEMVMKFPGLADQVAQYRNAANHFEPFSRAQLDELRKLLLNEKDGALQKVYYWTNQ